MFEAMWNGQENEIHVHGIHMLQDMTLKRCVAAQEYIKRCVAA